MNVEEVSREETPQEVEEHDPHPVHIVEVDEDHSFKLNEEGIASILMKEEVVDMPVVVVSVAGAFRKGKSFILNFFLRYLSHLENDSWLGDPDANLDGFSWRGGSDRDTTGILMWNEVFKVDVPSRGKVAVVLMDTQGAFDSSSTVKDCATIFALSTMTSSVQIYNISQNLQEDDLQHLELFTEYGRLAMEDSEFKPFQMLQFLIRDWSFPYEYPYGNEGGMKFLETRLKLTERPEELQRVRKHIQSCFTELSCFLMPHPGLSVATNPHFKGALKDITPDFKEQVTVLAPLLLSPDRLQTKKINGASITCGELVEYFRAYMKIYDGENLPEPKTMLQATAEANNLAAVAKSREVYNNAMEKVCGSSCAFVNPKILEKEHESSRQSSLECFDTTRKMGGDSFSAEYREKLELAIAESYENFTKTNDSKNVFKNFRTPAVFLSLALLNYLLSGMFGFVYLTSLASLCNLFLLASFVALVLWGYVSYVGQYSDVNQTLDLCADFFWLLFMAKIYESAMNEGAKQLSKGALNNLMKDSSDKEKKTQ